MTVSTFFNLVYGVRLAINVANVGGQIITLKKKVSEADRDKWNVLDYAEVTSHVNSVATSSLAIVLDLVTKQCQNEVIDLTRKIIQGGGELESLTNALFALKGELVGLSTVSNSYATASALAYTAGKMSSASNDKRQAPPPIPEKQPLAAPNKSPEEIARVCRTDPVLRKYKCGITNKFTPSPVSFIKDGRATYFDLIELQEWVLVAGDNPLTGEPLRIEDIHVDLEARATIRARLAHLSISLP